MRRLGLACAAVLMLSACGRAPTPIEPTRTAPATRAASASPAPDSAGEPPTLPAIAKRNDATGAANFVAYWVKVSNYAARTGDTRLLREISTDDCDGCLRYITLYERTYAAGGYFRDGDRKLDAIQTQSDTSGTYISGRLIAQPGTYRTSKAAKEHRSAAETTAVTFLAQFTDGVWTMADVGLATS